MGHTSCPLENEMDPDIRVRENASVTNVPGFQGNIKPAANEKNKGVLGFGSWRVRRKIKDICQRERPKEKKSEEKKKSEKKVRDISQSQLRVSLRLSNCSHTPTWNFLFFFIALPSFFRPIFLFFFSFFSFGSVKCVASNWAAVLGFFLFPSFCPYRSSPTDILLHCIFVLRKKQMKV